jgi:hypothetical protein
MYGRDLCHPRPVTCVPGHVSSDVWSWSRTHRWGPGGRGTGGVQEGGRKGINEEGGRKDINKINEEHIEQEGGRAQREGAAGVRNCAQRRDGREVCLRCLFVQGAMRRAKAPPPEVRL